ncbi:uncharacterized protein [Rutidosis leptorrhynchoides]|uniref:uncharacterized protein n=1 Tax=Rutidosis leptorrhynchoides TaxID=125765 RepID=UPI003A98D2AB
MPIMLDLENITPSVPKLWELYTDGASGPEGASAGLLLTGLDNEEHTYALRFNFKATKNEAEYGALLAGVRMAKKIGVKILDAYVDSQLIANQINGTFDAHDKGMQVYLALLRSPIIEFDDSKIIQIPRSQNMQEDVFSKLVALTFNHLKKKVLVEQIFKKSIELSKLTTVIEEAEHCCMTNNVEFLKTGSLPKDDKEAKKIKVKAPMYELRDDVLYKKSYLRLSFHCVGPKQAEKIIDDVHTGVCALHSGFRTVAEKIKRLSYCWSDMYNDAAERIRVCQECQFHVPISKAPRHSMITITSPWPFCKLAIDIVGSFPTGSGSTGYLVVAINFFTKWVEAKPLNKITSKKVRDFL